MVLVSENIMQLFRLNYMEQDNFNEVQRTAIFVENIYY